MTIDEIELLRTFRSDVPEPTSATAARVYALVTAHSNRSRRRPSRFVVVIAIAIAAVTVATLGLTAPWHGGPNVLEKAAAALATPTPGTIVSEDVIVHAQPTKGGPGFTVRMQIWLAGTPSHRFRVRLVGPSRPGGQTAATEIGGTLGRPAGLTYDPTNDVFVPATIGFPINATDLEPSAFIRAALGSGRAQLEGTTTISGRKVIRIRLETPINGHPAASTTYEVDANIYRPVRVETHAIRPNAAPLGFPMAAILELPFGDMPGTNTAYDYTYSFDQYRYLDPSHANLALTDIRAQHPRATVA
jgi:hypothetical protein